MENDSLAAGRCLLLLTLCGVLLGAAPAQAAMPFGLSPLKPLVTGQGQGQSAATASQGTGAASAPAPSSGLPPLPLFAQANTNGAAQPVPFAAPTPGSVVDDDEEENKAEAEKEAKKKAAIECDTDAQCPAQTVCALHLCKSVKPMTSAILYFHRPGPIGFRMLVPFYFSFWHPNHSTRVVPPLFVDKRDNKEQSRDLWVFPTYQYHRDPGETMHRVWPFFFYSNYGKEGRSISFLPFFFFKQRGSSRTEVVPPLLFYEHIDDKKRERDTVFLPALLYLRQRGDDALGLFLGLGYYRKVGEKVNGGYFPLVWYSSNPTEHKTVVLPLFFEGENKETGSRYATLLPLFLYYRSPSQNRLFLTPLGAAYHDHESQEDTMAMLVPPLVRRDTPAYRVTVIPPLAAWWVNKQNGHRFGYTGPFFYSRDDEGGSEGLVPIYMRFWSNSHHSSTVIIPPIVSAFHRSPELRMGFIGPAYGWSRPPEHSFGGGLLPLFSFASGQRSHFLLLPPVLIYTADRQAGRYHFSLGPIFYRSTTRGADAGWDAGIFPLLFFSHHGARRTEALIPLFYHHRRPFNERLQLGIFFYDRTCPQYLGDPRAGVQGGIVPLLFWKRTPEHSYTVLFPLFFEARSKTASTWMAGPVFYHRQKLAEGQGDRTTFGVFPLFYARQSKEEALVVAPLVGYRRTAERRTLFVGPYIETVSAPGRPEQAINRAVFPLFFFHCSPGHRATVLFPLYMQVDEEKMKFRSVLLLYYGVKTEETQAHALLPLFFSMRGPGRSTTVVGPIFHHKNEKTGSLAFGIVPLFGYKRDLESTLLVTPIGVYQNNHVESRIRSTFLLFYGDFQRNRADFGLFPLFFATRRGTAKAVFVTPFFYNSRDPSEDRTFTLLGPLFFGHNKKMTYGGIFPLVFGRNDGDGGYRFGIFPLVYASHKSPGTNTLVTPVFGFSTNSDGYRFYIGPFYVRREMNQRSVAFFPLFYDGQNVAKQERTTFLLPLFFRSATPDKSLTMVTPLFWHQRTLTRRVSLFLPLFLDIHNVFRERTTAFGPVVPLFVRMRDEANDITSWIFPPLLTYVRRAPDGNTTAVTFPIIWHWKSADRQTTVIFPLIFYAQRPATKTLVVMPLFAYRRDEQDNRSLMVMPLLTWARNGSDGSRERVVFPFIWHFKSAERQTTVVFPLIWHAKRPNYTVTVFLPFGAHWTTEKGASTMVLNTYVYKGTGAYKGAWSFHFWPIFSVGRPHPHDLEWTILTGLVGYSREGVNRTLRLLWGIPIHLEPVGTKTSWYGASWRMASDGF